MSSHPDADAFVRAILHDPAEVTTRLAFADWLDETGDSSNVVWAQFIRLKARPVGAPNREELELEAAAYWWRIRATLALPGGTFVRHPEPFLQLLPPWALCVTLADVQVPLAVVELVPESVARENVVLPLYHRDNSLILASAEPGQYDTLQKLQFILNKDVVAVRADVDQLAAAINAHYGQTETESVVSVSYEAPLVGLDGDETSGAVYGIFHTAFSRNCSGFEMEQAGTRCVLRYIARADRVPDEHHPPEVFARLLDHLLSLPPDAEYAERGARCVDVDIPLLSGRRFPATVERRPVERGVSWFRVRFRREAAR